MRDNLNATGTTATKSYRWVILLLCWFIYFSFGLVSTTLSTIVSPVMRDLNLSYSQMGFILGTWQLVYMVAAIPIGFLIDRIGTFKSMLLAASLVSLSAILRTFANSFETMTILVGLFGIGGCMVSIGLPKVVSIWFLGKERATASGIYATGSATGAIVALSLTNSVVIPLVGTWQMAYLSYGLFGLLIAVVWLLRGRSPPVTGIEKLPDAQTEKGKLQGVKQAFSRNVILVILIGIASFLVGHGVQQWLPSILQFNGMDAVTAGLAVSVVNVFLLFGYLLMPRLPYWLGSKKLAICIALAIQGITVALVSVVSGPTLWTVLALKGISGGFNPLLGLVLMDLPEVGPARMGMVGGFYFAIGEIGGFGGPAIMGLIKDTTGSFLWGLLLLAGVSFAMIIPTLFLKIDKKTKPVLI